MVTDFIGVRNLITADVHSRKALWIESNELVLPKARVIVPEQSPGSLAYDM